MWGQYNEWQGCGYATGGLWYTKNNGQNLVPVFGNENTFVVGDSEDNN